MIAAGSGSPVDWPASGAVLIVGQPACSQQQDISSEGPASYSQVGICDML